MNSTATENTDVKTTAHSALKGRDMLCFSHDWNGDPLSKTHLMRLLARDNRILWVNSIGNRTPTVSKRDIRRAFKKLFASVAPIKEVEHNIFVVNPLILPIYGRPWVYALNQKLLRMQVKRAMARLGFRRPINWVFNPAAAIIAGTLGEEQLIYYCVDEYTAFTGVSGNHLAALEEKLLRRADLVVVSAEKLYKTKAPFNSNTVLIRHGVDYSHFRKALNSDTKIPDEIANLPRPIIGYFGLMATDWIDLELLIKIARHFSHGSLVLLGKVTMDMSPVTAFPNVHLLGRKPFDTLPAYSKGFDAAILPFPISEVTLNANPLKVREYLAAGLPVVSTKIPEVEFLGHAAIADTHDAFIWELENVLKYPGPKAWRSELMRSESWEGRVEELRGHYAKLSDRCQAAIR